MSSRRLAVSVILSGLTWSACASYGAAPVEPVLLRAGLPAKAGFVITVDGRGYKAVDKVEKLAVAFMELSANGCEIEQPCYYFALASAPYQTPARAPHECKVHQGYGGTGTTVECPAKGPVVFRMGPAGTWSGYIGDGKHTPGSCPSSTIAVYTSSATGSTYAWTQVHAWDGCRETIVCVKAKGATTTVQADTRDVVRGRCTSVKRHRH